MFEVTPRKQIKDFGHRVLIPGVTGFPWVGPFWQAFDCEKDCQGILFRGFLLKHRTPLQSFPVLIYFARHEASY
jgi:hypothetical protein